MRDGRKRSNGGDSAASLSTSIARLVHFDPARRLGLGDGLPDDRHDRLVGQPGDLFELGCRLDDDLGGPSGVAQNQEADAADPAQAVQPPLEENSLADVTGEIHGPDAFHDDTSHEQRPLIYTDEGALVVPPHFVAPLGATLDAG